MTVRPQPIRNDAEHLADAAQDLQYLHSSAESALALLTRLLEDGDHDGHQGIPAMLDLARRAFTGWQDRYPNALYNIETHLRPSPEKGGDE